jgi:glycolate oxidase iron-sulfur subunit
MQHAIDAPATQTTAVAGTTGAAATTAPVDAGIPYDLFLDCVHCGLCTAACPTYLETGNENDSPRGRIYLMRGATDGRIDLSPDVRRHLELCLDCRSCETACPSGVQYGRLIEPFRVAMEQSGDAARPKTGDWFHRLILFGLFPYPGRVRWAVAPARLAQVLGLDWLLGKLGVYGLLPARLRQLHDMLPRFRFFTRRLPELLPATGRRRARVALFTGCVGDALFRETNWATARVLQANGCEVVVPRSQVCCGAIHYHAGQAEPALDFLRANCRAFDPAGVDAIVVNVAGCGAMLKDYAHIAAQAGVEPESADRFTAKVRDISEFLVELGPVPPPGALPLTATYHDACHLAHAQRIRTQPRRLLELIPGLKLLPLAETEVCCGAAGTYNLTEPEMSERLAQRKQANIRATGAEAVFTANIGCLMQIQRKLRETESRMWAAHPIEALDLSYRGLRAPTDSRRKAVEWATRTLDPRHPG